MRNKSDHFLSGIKFGIFGKGGSGKSTVTTLLATALMKRGYRVVILDADSTNVGLHHALGFKRAPRPLLDYHGGMVFQGGHVKCPIDDPAPLTNPKIDLMSFPEEYFVRDAEGLTLFQAGKIGDKGPGAGCDGPMAKIARDVEFHMDGDAPLTLVDFKAGFEDSARGAIVTLDYAIVVVEPTRPSIEIAKEMRNLTYQIRAGISPATQHYERAEQVELANYFYRHSRLKDTFCILNKVNNAQENDLIEDELRTSKLKCLGSLPATPLIVHHWFKGQKLHVPQLNQELNKISDGLEKQVNQNNFVGAPRP
jgi:CO dehydrogenase maturation factor